MIAGLMVGILHVPLGIEVLRRGIIFIDLAIAQIAGLCVVLVNLWAHEASWFITQSAAMLSALTAAFFFRWIEKTVPKEQEAVIGSSFIVAAAGVLLALANHPHGGEEVQHILSGQILFVSWDHILASSPIYIAGLILWFVVPAIRLGIWFFVLFAIVVAASVQLVGVYVVFASLILPALAVNRPTPKTLQIAITFSVLSIISGIALSALLDLPSGPVIVFAFAAVTVIARIAPQRSASH
ncbi:MAG: zinc/manganese transporter permease [Rhodospirillaceae bacterium]|nr:zinc/manganese transporter permease [Rhodospirillaceae bacterium]|tara:strand:+ start:2680 stop:3399 length:720 start_codon:yes stop_codon:yes gene_type:complete